MCTHMYKLASFFCGDTFFSQTCPAHRPFSESLHVAQHIGLLKCATYPIAEQVIPIKYVKLRNYFAGDQRAPILRYFNHKMFSCRSIIAKRCVLGDLDMHFIDIASVCDILFSCSTYFCKSFTYPYHFC